MREIKFRAWTGKKMYYQDDQYLASFVRRAVPEIIADNDDEHPGRPASGYRNHESYLPNGGDIEEYLLQYTGLKDKNGVEIYEGDIVEVTENIKTSGRVQDDGSTLWNIIDAGLRFEVGWNDLSPSWHLYPIPLDNSSIDESAVMAWLWDNDGGSDCLEVIGNTYENPELLK